MTLSNAERQRRHRERVRERLGRKDMSALAAGALDNRIEALEEQCRRLREALVLARDGGGGGFAARHPNREQPGQGRISAREKVQMLVEDLLDEGEKSGILDDPVFALTAGLFEVEYDPFPGLGYADFFRHFDASGIPVNQAVDLIHRQGLSPSKDEWLDWFQINRHYHWNVERRWKRWLRPLMDKLSGSVT